MLRFRAPSSTTDQFRSARTLLQTHRPELDDSNFSSKRSKIESSPQVPSVLSVDYVEELTLLSQQSGAQALTSNPNSISKSDHGPRYFEAVWGKASNRKHKRWEADAVLLVQGTMASLFDTDGKVIGRSSGFHSNQLAVRANCEKWLVYAHFALFWALQDGSRIVIGGKEVEVQNELSRQSFLAGQCFRGPGSKSSANTVMMTSPDPVQSRSVFIKPFVAPLKDLTNNNGSAPCSSLRLKQGLALFNPDTPGALVMPYPNEEHQRLFNRKGWQMNKVVVDPRLSQQLRPHQREGVVFLYRAVLGMDDTSMHGAILADEMGLGKSLQTIALIWTLIRQNPYGILPSVHKVLLVCPSSLVHNWQAEFRKWLGDERLRVFVLAKTCDLCRYEQTSHVNPVLILSYDMTVRCSESLQRIGFDLLVCDEGHRMKNVAVKTNSTLSSLDIRRRILLTGTPVQNDLQEFFTLVDFVNPGLLGSARKFKQVFENAISDGRQNTMADEEEIEMADCRLAELQTLTRTCLLRRTAIVNCQYLPPKTEYILFCRPSPVQIEIYRKILSDLRLSYFVATQQHFSVIDTLRKICNHPVLLQARYPDDKPSEIESALPEKYADSDLHLNDSGKMTVLFDIVRSVVDLNQKLVIVSNFTRTLDLIEAMCTSSCLKWLRLDGQTPVSKRLDQVKRFNSSTNTQEMIFLLSSKAGGQGLNLIGANRIVLYDVDWNPTNDSQAMARIWRDGQINPCHIYRLITTGTIEEKMLQRQIKKSSLSGLVVDAMQVSKLNFSMEELRDLFTLNTHTDCNTHDLMNCDCDGNGVIFDGYARKKTAKSASLAELFSWRHLLPSNPTALNELGNVADFERLFDRSFVSFVLQLFISNKCGAICFQFFSFFCRSDSTVVKNDKMAQ